MEKIGNLFPGKTICGTAVQLSIAQDLAVFQASNKNKPVNYRRTTGLKIYMRPKSVTVKQA